MKKLLFIILLLFAVQIKAQDMSANVMSSKNTTTTLLGSAGTFTGTAELLRGYNSISITIRADQNGTYKVLFGNTSTITTANAVKTYSFSYTANDTLHTKSIPVDAPYFKVVFTNSGAVAQTKFYLIIMLNRGHTLPVTELGKVDVSISNSALPSGASTSANQTNGTQTTMITGSPNNYATWFSTVGTVKDSVQFGFTTRSVTFINDGVLTDTLFVSTSNSFPSTNTIKRLGGEGFTKQWATTKLYFKVGTTPLASKKIRVEAN
ncbi:hypothetical protein M1146_07305 [Patescibacteria group bacterium]|nr:hypothetical protein [Patescibacteria group bacterium]